MTDFISLGDARKELTRLIESSAVNPQLAVLARALLAITVSVGKIREDQERFANMISNMSHKIDGDDWPMAPQPSDDG